MAGNVPNRVVDKKQREASVLEKLRNIDAEKNGEASVLEKLRSIDAEKNGTARKNAISDWETLARERSLQEQAMLKEERDKLRVTLQSVDSSVAVTVQKNLEICATAIAQMRQYAVELRRLMEEARSMTKQLDDLENLQMANAILESSQLSMASDIQTLRSELNELKAEVKGFLQTQDTRSLSNAASDVNYMTAYDFTYQSSTLIPPAPQHDPEIYILGGYSGKSWLQTMETYSPKSGHFSSRAPMLGVRSYAAASVLEGYIYVFGGGDGKSWFDTVECYNHENDCWTKCSPLGHKRGSLAGATLGDRVFAVGGGNGKVHFAEVECYDTQLGTWIPSTNMLEKRFMVAAAELGGALYALGGFDGKQYLKTMERFDPREALWTRMPSMTAKRGSLSAGVLNEKLYALGGFDGSGFLDTVEVFDPRAGKWESAQPMSGPRAYGAAVVVDNAIYVIGGLAGTKSTLCEDMEVYKEGAGWTNLSPPGLGKRSFLAAAVL